MIAPTLKTQAFSPEEQRMIRGLCSSSHNRRRTALQTIRRLDKSQFARIVRGALEKYSVKKHVLMSFVVGEGYALLIASIFFVGSALYGLARGDFDGALLAITGTLAACMGVALFRTSRSLSGMETTLREALDEVTDTRMAIFLLSFVQYAGKQVSRPALLRLLKAITPDELVEWNSQGRRFLRSLIETPQLSLPDPELTLTALPLIAMIGNRETLKHVRRLQGQLDGMSSLKVVNRLASTDLLAQLRESADGCARAIEERLIRETARETLLRASAETVTDGKDVLLRAATGHVVTDGDELLRAANESSCAPNLELEVAVHVINT
jgi:hypothetical protein